MEKEVRPLSELYQILYDTIQFQTTVYGLCHEIQFLYNYYKISKEENYLLLKHFLNQKPSLFKHFFFFTKSCYNGHSYWWSNLIKDKEKSSEQRKKFILKMIKITKKQNI